MPTPKKKTPGKASGTIHKEISNLTHEEKLKNLEPTFEIPKASEWKVWQAAWHKMTEDERSDTVFGIVFLAGGDAKQIMRAFRIDEKVVNGYHDLIQQAKAIRKLKIQQHQMRWAFTSNQFAAAKFFLGLQFAEQVQNPVHEGIESLGSDNELTIKVIGKDGAEKPAEPVDELKEGLAALAPAMNGKLGLNA